jgi:hypothetical protein
MAVVILDGIVTSTALNMVVLPALYLKYGRAVRRGEREVPTLGPPRSPATDRPSHSPRSVR